MGPPGAHEPGNLRGTGRRQPENRPNPPATESFAARLASGKPAWHPILRTRPAEGSPARGRYRRRRIPAAAARPIPSSVQVAGSGTTATPPLSPGAGL